MGIIETIALTATIFTCLLFGGMFFIFKKIITVANNVMLYQHKLIKSINPKAPAPKQETIIPIKGDVYTPSKDVMGVGRGEYDELFD